MLLHFDFVTVGAFAPALEGSVAITVVRITREIAANRLITSIRILNVTNATTVRSLPHSKEVAKNLKSVLSGLYFLGAFWR